MSNTTWKRSGSIHQVRLSSAGFFVCDDDDDDSDDDDGPYLFSIIIANGVSFFLSSRMLETTSNDAQKLTICPFLSRLSLARHRILENVVRRTRRQNVVAVRLRRLVQERVGPTGHRRRRYRFHVRRQLELILGGKVRTRVPRNERFVGQTVR